MSERRIVEETPCPDCDRFHTESLLRPGGDPESSIAYCYTGGSRRVLTEGQYVLIEKVDGEWQLPIRIAMYDGDGGPVNDQEMFDYIVHALSDHTEGTP